MSLLMRRFAVSLAAAVALAAGCTTQKPQVPGSEAVPAAAPQSGQVDASPTPTPPPAVEPGPGVLPANAPELAERARQDPDIGDPLEPDLPAISVAVVEHLRGEGQDLVEFNAATEALVLGEEGCEVTAARLDELGLTPARLYELASGVPDDTIASAFVSDIAEKLRHVDGCDEAGGISFTHTMVARILATAGVR